MKHQIRKHKRHIGVLYVGVMILLALQAISFISTSSQAAKILSEQQEVKSQIEDQILDLKRENQNNIGEIVRIISQQKTDFDNQIELLKSTQQDFSGVIEDSLKKVVSIATDHSAGTGSVVKEGGYIITNNHVVADANVVNVLTYDNRILPAQVIGTDPLTDLALLKVENSGLESFEFISSDEVVVGSKVLAMGNPLGLSFSVTEGIVSAVNRVGPNHELGGIYIQTDAPANPGNSGGPLVNNKGEIVGIINFKAGGNSEGLSFAIEGDVVLQKIDEMLNPTQPL